MQQQPSGSKQGEAGGNDLTHDLNWLEFWPEAEFRLDQAPAAAGPLDLVGELLPVSNMLPQTHNGGVSQAPGHLRDPYASAGVVDREASFKVCVCKLFACSPSARVFFVPY